MKTTLLLIIALFTLASCASNPVRYEGVVTSVFAPSTLAAPSAEHRTSMAALATSLQALSPSVSTQDAQLLAREAHIYPLHLANVWRISDSPLLHNLATNNGEREYGLCIDWTYALRERMKTMGFTSFDWHWGIANQGSALREHSTLVVTAKGAPFASGIALDPWRHSGRLYWARLPNDASYDWKPYLDADKWQPRGAKL